KMVERPEPQAAINDVVVGVYAAGFVNTELEWPSTWADRAFRDRTPSILGHELAGVVTALGYGTTGLSVGQRVFGLADWHRDGTMAEYVAIEARNLAPLPGDVDFTVGASLPISGLTAWQGLFQHGRLQAGQSVLAHGAAGAVGTMVTQLARESGAYVIGTGRAADRQKALDFGVEADRGQLGEIVQRVRDDDCARTSAPSQPSTTPSPPSTRPSDARGKQSSTFVREDSGTAIGPSVLVDQHEPRSGVGRPARRRHGGHESGTDCHLRTTVSSGSDIVSSPPPPVN